MFNKNIYEHILFSSDLYAFNRSLISLKTLYITTQPAAITSVRGNWGDNRAYIDLPKTADPVMSNWKRRLRKRCGYTNHWPKFQSPSLSPSSCWYSGERADIQICGRARRAESRRLIDNLLDFIGLCTGGMYRAPIISQRVGNPPSYACVGAYAPDIRGICNAA